MNTMYKPFDGQDPYEGLRAYMSMSRKIDKLVADYKAKHKVSRVSDKVMARLVADIK